MISYFNKINCPIYPQSPAQDMAVHSTERMVSMDGVPSILPTLGARQECKDSKLCSMDFHLFLWVCCAQRQRKYLTLLSPHLVQLTHWAKVSHSCSEA